MFYQRPSESTSCTVYCRKESGRVQIPLCGFMESALFTVRFISRFLSYRLLWFYCLHYQPSRVLADPLVPARNINNYFSSSVCVMRNDQSGGSKHTASFKNYFHFRKKISNLTFVSQGAALSWKDVFGVCKVSCLCWGAVTRKSLLLFWMNERQDLSPQTVVPHCDLLAPFPIVLTAK